MRRREFVTGAVALAAYAQLPRQAGLLAPALGAEAGDDQLPDDQLPFGFHNFTGSNLANWRTALAAQQRGSSNAVLGCLGDSTVAGQGAASRELGSNAKRLSAVLNPYALSLG